MSDASDFQNVLKSVPEATSLNSTDRLMAFNEAGELKKISRDNVVNQDKVMSAVIPAGEERWIRIAKATNYGSGCLLSVNFVGFNPSWHIPIAMCVSCGHGSSNAMKHISAFGKYFTSTGNANYPFSKIRITGNEGTSYIDILIRNATVARTLRVAMSNSIGMSVVSPEENPEPAQYTKEFELSEIFGGGGGKTLFYNALQFSAERRAA